MIHHKGIPSAIVATAIFPFAFAAVVIYTVWEYFKQWRA